MQSIYSLLLSKTDKPHLALRYIKFIEFFSNTGGEIKHHILPKAKDLWPEFSNLKNNKWNESLLTPRQHFIAHWMLHKIFSGSQTFAFYAMRNKDKMKLNSRAFEKLLLQRNELLRSESHRNKMRQIALKQHSEGKGGMLNKTQSEYQKQVVREYMTGRPKKRESVEKQIKSRLKTITAPDYVNPYKRTAEHNKAISQSLKGLMTLDKNNNAKSVTINDVYYSTMKEAVESTGISIYLINKSIQLNQSRTIHI